MVVNFYKAVVESCTIIAPFCIALLFFGCATVLLTKTFVPLKSKSKYDKSIQIQPLHFEIDIDVLPWNESEFQDSTYNMRFRVYRPNSDCNTIWKKAFETINFKKLDLRYGEFEVKAISDTSGRLWMEYCSINWDFKPVVIPDRIDTLYVAMSLSYKFDDTVRLIDTTVIIRRMEKREKVSSY